MKFRFQLLIAGAILLPPSYGFADGEAEECARVGKVMDKACASSAVDKSLGTQVRKFCQEYSVNKKAAIEKLDAQNRECAAAGKKTSKRAVKKTPGAQSKAVAGHGELAAENQKKLEECATKLGLIKEDFRLLAERVERGRTEVESSETAGLTSACREAAKKSFEFLKEDAEKNRTKTEAKEGEYTDAAKAVEGQGKQDKDNAGNMKGGDPAADAKKTDEKKPEDKGGAGGGAPPITPPKKKEEPKKDPRAEAEKVRQGKILECETQKKKLQNDMSDCKNSPGNLCNKDFPVEPNCSNQKRCILDREAEYRLLGIHPKRNCNDIPLVILPQQ